MVKNVCRDDDIIIAGVNVSDHVVKVEATHAVGELVMCTVTFQGVRIEPKPGARGQHIFHLVERDDA